MPSPKIPELWDENWLRIQYVEKGHTAYEIGKELGCSSSTVANAIRRQGLPQHPSGYKSPNADYRKGGKLREVSDTWLEEQYVIHGRSSLQISHDLDVSQQSVHARLKKIGVPMRKPGNQPAEVDSTAWIRMNDREWLVQQYTVRGRSVRDLSKELGVSRTALNSTLEGHGITLRSNANRRKTFINTLSEKPPVEPDPRRKEGPLTMRVLSYYVSWFYGLTVAEMEAPREGRVKKDNILHARRVYCHLAIKLLGVSTGMIAERLHTSTSLTSTAYYSISEYRQSCVAFEMELNKLELLIKERK